MYAFTITFRTVRTLKGRPTTYGKSHTVTIAADDRDAAVETLFDCYTHPALSCEILSVE